MANNSTRALCFQRVASAVGTPIASIGMEQDLVACLCEADWHPYYIARVLGEVRGLDGENDFVRELGDALKRDPTAPEIEYACQRRAEGASPQAVATELREDDEAIAGRNPPRARP